MRFTGLITVKISELNGVGHIHCNAEFAAVLIEREAVFLFAALISVYPI